MIVFDICVIQPRIQNLNAKDDEHVVSNTSLKSKMLKFTSRNQGNELQTGKLAAARIWEPKKLRTIFGELLKKGRERKTGNTESRWK